MVLRFDTTLARLISSSRNLAAQPQSILEVSLGDNGRSPSVSRLAAGEALKVGCNFRDIYRFSLIQSVEDLSSRTIPLTLKKG
jgi:hypothetical protein